MTDPLTPALIMKLNCLDAVTALEDTISYCRIALTNSFERPTMEAVRGESESMLVTALALLCEAHDALTAAAEAEG